MRLDSVNVALPVNGTAIGKRPVAGPVEVRRLGLHGDGVGSPEHHGGRDQAAYAYGLPDYAWWEAELGRELPPGTFGENLTVSGLASGDALVGDRMRVGAAVVLEVTSGRIPCGTLTARIGIRAFATRFRHAHRPGLYCRVIATGAARAGDRVRYERATLPTVGVVEFAEMYWAKPGELTVAQIERALAAPICERGRRETEDQLAALRSP